MRSRTEEVRKRKKTSLITWGIGNFGPVFTLQDFMVIGVNEVDHLMFCELCDANKTFQLNLYCWSDLTLDPWWSSHHCYVVHCHLSHFCHSHFRYSYFCHSHYCHSAVCCKICTKFILWFRLFFHDNLDCFYLPCHFSVWVECFIQLHLFWLVLSVIKDWVSPSY